MDRQKDHLFTSSEQDTDIARNYFFVPSIASGLKVQKPLFCPFHGGGSPLRNSSTPGPPRSLNLQVP